MTCIQQKAIHQIEQVAKFVFHKIKPSTTPTKCTKFSQIHIPRHFHKQNHLRWQRIDAKSGGAEN
jgi:hypothetical protein